MRKIVVSFFSILLFFFSTCVFAVFYNYSSPVNFTPGFYIGLQGGYASTGWSNIENTFDYGQVLGTSVFATRVFAGYDMHSNFAIEGGYTQFFNNTKIYVANKNTVYKPKFDKDIDVVGKLKVNVINNFNLYAKAGISYVMISQGLDGEAHNAFNIVYGAGGVYQITNSTSVGLSWTRFYGNPKWSYDYIPYTDLFAVGVSYKFD